MNEIETPTSEWRKQVRHLLNRTEYEGVVVKLTRHGRVVAVQVPVEMYERWMAREKTHG